MRSCGFATRRAPVTVRVPLLSAPHCESQMLAHGPFQPDKATAISRETLAPPLRRMVRRGVAVLKGDNHVQES
jgi:hypothetical protein